MNGDKQIKSSNWLTEGYSEEELATMKAEAIKEAEIEEMAKDFCAVGMPCEECHLYKNRCHAKKYATRAYNAGYRKASELAEEIFAEIERIANMDYQTPLGTWVTIRKDLFSELKKKYTESEKDK